MGMFDHINYRGHEYQTKDTPRQLCDYYAIEGGELWAQEYDAEWTEDDTTMIKGYLKQSNHRWVRCADFTGTVRFYRSYGMGRSIWKEYIATVECGIVTKVEETTE